MEEIDGAYVDSYMYMSKDILLFSRYVELIVTLRILVSRLSHRSGCLEQQSFCWLSGSLVANVKIQGAPSVVESHRIEHSTPPFTLMYPWQK